MVTKEETKAAESTSTAEVAGYDYELVFIVNPEVTDEALEPMINNVTQYITGKGGAVVEIARWGRKKLAYPIKHLMEGNYVLIKFKIDPLANKELENNLRISEKIIRHLLIKID